MKWGGRHSIQLWTDPFEPCPHEVDPSFDFEREVSSFLDNATQIQELGRLSTWYQVNLWPAASMASGAFRDAWSGVCSSIVSVLISYSARPAASKIVTKNMS